jgi:hypothetical protein
LKGQHIDRAVKNAVEIRKHLPLRHGSPYRNLNSSLLYGLLAHSHVWKSQGSTPTENIDAKLWTADTESVRHPREMLDLVCVADLTTWLSTKMPKIAGSTRTGYIMCTSGGRETLTTLFTPIGEMISFLLQRLAWEDPTMRDLAHYFGLVIGHSGHGNLRTWDVDSTIYSREVMEGILSQQLPGEPVDGWNLPYDVWSEWRVSGW